MKRIGTFCEKYQIEIIILLFCLPAFLHLGELSGYKNPYFLIDYSTGFGGRKLLGQLCNLWLPKFGVRTRHVLLVYLATHTIGICLFAHICGSSLKKAKGKSDFWFLLFILLTYMFSPYSFKGITQMIGSDLDIILVDFSLVFCCLFIYKRDSTIYYLSTVLLLLAACLTHHIFCCIYFPLFLSLFIYDVFINGFNKRKLLGYGSIVIALFALFCYIMFFSKMNIGYEPLLSQLKNRTSELEIDNGAVYYEYYASLSEHIPRYIIPFLKVNIIKFVLHPILLFPLFFIFASPLIIAAQRAELKLHKMMYYLMFMSQLLILPAFVMAIDYGRWYYAYFFCQFMQNWVLLSIGDNGFHNVISAMKSFWLYIKKHPFLFALIISAYVYNLSFSYAGDIMTAPPIEYIIKFFKI